MFSHVLRRILTAALAASSITAAYAVQDAPRPQNHVSRSPPSPRPFHPIAPYSPGAAFPESPPRNRTCYVKSNGDGKDDSGNVLDAIRQCNDGGHVVFERGIKYVVGTALDLTFLKQIDLDIQGTIQFTNDTQYWQTHSFNHTFQNATSFFQLGGTDINVFGGGTIDGNGQAWYDLYARDIYILRPILFASIGLHRSRISDLNLRYSPQWYNLVANSTEVVFSNISIAGKSTSKNAAKNTDGWDTYRSSDVVIQNSVVSNGDDCVSFKPNSSDVVVQGLVCEGSHGVSVGSLGQYVGTVDVVRNILVHNTTLTHSTSGARIKVWPGLPSALSGDLQGGGGSGSVTNITYSSLTLSSVDYAVEITQCYGQRNITLCHMYPSNLTISGVEIKEVKGTTSGKNGGQVAYAVCSSEGVCGGIGVQDFDVRAPNGGTGWTCGRIKGLEGQVNCTGTAV